jgi:TIR domain
LAAVCIAAIDGRVMAGKIFINYRRGDDAGYSGRLFDRLQDVFAPQQLFMDVDNIAPGLDFVRVLNDRVAECDVVLAVIGRNWIDARDAAGKRRLDDPEDFVRIEIASALDQGKRVIPVLVADAPMPRPDDLPEALRPLSRRNAVRLTHERFRSDTQGLIKALQQSLEEIEARRLADAQAAGGVQTGEERHQKAQDPQPKRQLPRPAMVIAGMLAVLLIAGSAFYWFETKPPSSPAQQTSALATASPAATAQSANTPLPDARIAALAAADAAKPPPVQPDQIAWSIVKDSRDTDELRRFIGQFPNSTARADAETRIAALAAEAAQTAADKAAHQQDLVRAQDLAREQDLARALQFELKRVGCFTGDVNGQFDDATKAAWHSFIKLAAIGMPDDLSADAVKAVRGINKRVCPLQCSTGQHADGDQCVADPPKSAETAPARPSSHPAAKSRGGGRCFNFQGRQFCE